jgi:hypothetical protein
MSAHVLGNVVQEQQAILAGGARAAGDIPEIFS